MGAAGYADHQMHRRRPLGAIFMLALVALALAGCSKCDMPVWRHDSAAPQSCHDEAPPQ
jgi:hypothetical protein